jgi:probable phosphoglycerate mutase
MMAMTHLYFVRHGESEMNLQAHLVGGRSNHVNLTEKGIRQAKAFGRWLGKSSLRPNAVYFSPAARTIQTMDYSLETANLDLECFIDPRLQELSQGSKEGALRNETYTAEVLKQIEIEQLDFKIDGGESNQMVMDRKLLFAKDIAERHPDETVVAFGHGYAIRCLAGAIDNLSHDMIFRGLKTPNVSLSYFEITPAKNTVHYVGKRVIDEESV